MSDYTVFDDITSIILSLLRENIGELITTDRVNGESPSELNDDSQPGLSFFLYQIGENVHLKNQGVQETDTGNTRHPPLPLQLFYLLTAYAKARETEQQIMGRAMQILHDNKVLRGSLLKGSLAGTFEEITVMMNPLSVDEMNKLWSLFVGKSYRLSVAYKVSPVLLDSTREESVDRVIKKTVKFATKDG